MEIGHGLREAVQGGAIDDLNTILGELENVGGEVSHAAVTLKEKIGSMTTRHRKNCLDIANNVRWVGGAKRSEASDNDEDENENEDEDEDGGTAVTASPLKLTLFNSIHLASAAW